MNTEIIEKYLIHNGKCHPCENIESIFTGADPSIYEVIRIIDDIPLFKEKHLERMRASAKLLGYSIDVILEHMESSIHELIELNGSVEKNIKVIAYDLECERPQYIMYYIKSAYPSAQEYQNGVPTVLYHAERKNPNAKVINHSFKENVARLLDEAKAYEALLVNEAGLITEGSRSNAFFAKEGKLYTAPSSMVLVGITREYIYEACRRSGVDIIEQAVPAAALDTFDGMFLSGTSPKVLPISSINGKLYDSSANSSIKSVMKAYDDILNEYISSKK